MMKGVSVFDWTCFLGRFIKHLESETVCEERCVSFILAMLFRSFSQNTNIMHCLCVYKTDCEAY